MNILKYQQSNNYLYYRDEPSSDLAVINQIFNLNVYSLEGWMHLELMERYKNKIREEVPLIIDAGANMGASSIYFHDAWHNSFVIAVEPERRNFALLNLNTIDKKIKSIEGAIGNKAGKLFLNDPGAGDVGFRVKAEGEYKVNVYEINQLLVIEENLKPFIIKIDIEGGEKNLFDSNIEWLDKFPLTIIELHDWMLPTEGTSRGFQKAIAERNFAILQKGENLFCFNMDLLN